ncbi:MAG: phosphopentomutase [Coriobacteriia bacterium]|nr:phosphopentomutase [Coriobacteriia bacterium]
MNDEVYEGHGEVKEISAQDGGGTKCRAIVIVADSVGCGALPDADAYGDAHANTLLHIAQVEGGLSIPNLRELGIGHILEIPGGEAKIEPRAFCHKKLAEISAGKDTTTGHWELMGLKLDQPFPVYPQGFPREVMDRFVELTGYGYLGNVAASGTEIIERLGERHCQTGDLIVYTSADSVFQIAAHEDIVSREKLYEICEIVRNEILVGRHTVGRVIARPFVGNGITGFSRTSHRHDFAVLPPSETVLDKLRKKGVEVVGIGKISDIFCGRGISESHPTVSNDDGMTTVMEQLSTHDTGFIFANLVDFDMLWGHRRDVKAYKEGLEHFDAWLPRLMNALTERDLLIITADHGCDPTYEGSDHTREYVPVLMFTKNDDHSFIDTKSDDFEMVGKAVYSWLCR